MTTNELNNRCHRMVASISALCTKLASISDDTALAWPSGSDCDLLHGLDDARFMALASDFLTRLWRDHSQLRMEHTLLADELDYVRGKWHASEVRNVELEDWKALCRCGFGATTTTTTTTTTGQDEMIANYGADELRLDTSDDDLSMFDDDEDIDGVQAATTETDDDDDTADDTTGTTSDSMDIDFNDPYAGMKMTPGNLEAGSTTIIAKRAARKSSSKTPAAKRQTMAERSQQPHSNRTRLVAQQFANLLEAGQYDVATVVCKRMISTSSSNSSSTTKRVTSAERSLAAAAALEVLALDDRAAGRSAAAIEHMLAALRIYERHHYAGHPRIVATLNGVAQLYADSGQPELARPLCARALQLRRGACGARHRSVARQHQRVAALEQRCGNAELALQHYTEALGIYGSTHALDAREAAPAANGASSQGRQRGQNGQQRQRDGGAAQRTVNGIHEQMGELLVQMGRLPEAAGVYKEWLAPTQLLPAGGPLTPSGQLPPMATTPGSARRCGTRSSSAAGGNVSERRVVVASPATPAVLRPMRPIWEVAEEIERQCAGVGAVRRQSHDSYELGYDYRFWWESVRVHFPSACAALKRLAFVYRRMGMHYAARMLEHCCTLQTRKKTLRFPLDETVQPVHVANENDGGDDKENVPVTVTATTSVWHLKRRQERKEKERLKLEQQQQQQESVRAVLARLSPKNRL